MVLIHTVKWCLLFVQVTLQTELVMRVYCWTLPFGTNIHDTVLGEFCYHILVLSIYVTWQLAVYAAHL